MPSQTGKNLVVAFRVEATYNTAPGTGSAEQLRLFASPGMRLDRALIENGEIRSDGLTSMARLGSRQAPGSYSGPFAVDAYDTILEAIMRSTWVAAAAVTFDNGAALTSLTVNSASQVTFAGTTTPAAAGLRNGDVFRLTNMSTAANNSVNARVKSISGSVVNLHGTPLTTQAADNACTLTIQRKLKNGSTPTKRTFYVEEYNQDVDVSEVFGGAKWVGFKITGTPDGLATIDLQVLGASGNVLASGASPYYISPTQYTTDALVFVDATIAYNGTDIANATAFELSYMVAAKAEPVIGSTVTPDIFDNDAKLSGSISLIRQDLANVTLFLNETELELHVMLVENDSEPKDFVSLYVPRVKLTAADAPLGNDGAMIETLPWTAGAKAAATGYDATLMTISTSAT
jgi:hypothetical protein